MRRGLIPLATAAMTLTLASCSGGTTDGGGAAAAPEESGASSLTDCTTELGTSGGESTQEVILTAGVVYSTSESVRAYEYDEVSDTAEAVKMIEPKESFCHHGGEELISTFHDDTSIDLAPITTADGEELYVEGSLEAPIEGEDAPYAADPEYLTDEDLSAAEDLASGKAAVDAEADAITGLRVDSKSDYSLECYLDDSHGSAATPPDGTFTFAYNGESREFSTATSEWDDESAFSDGTSVSTSSGARFKIESKDVPSQRVPLSIEDVQCSFKSDDGSIDLAS